MVKVKYFLLKFEWLCRSDLALHLTWMFLIQTILLRILGKWSIIFTFIIALGKEYFDFLVKNSSFSNTDFIVTLIGGVLARLTYKE